MRKSSQVKKIDLVTLESIQGVLSTLQGEPLKKESKEDQPPALADVLLRFWGQITRLQFGKLEDLGSSREAGTFAFLTLLGMASTNIL